MITLKVPGPRVPGVLIGLSLLVLLAGCGSTVSAGTTPQGLSGVVQSGPAAPSGLGGRARGAATARGGGCPGGRGTLGSG
ncbi:MAG: hypothetical protein ACYDAQ_21385, partial [Mycobacteriales bacterium]